MPQQQLDMFQIPTGSTAQLRTRTPQIMRRELAEFGFPSVADDQAPDDLFVQDAGSLHHAGFSDGPEEAAFADPGRGGPKIDAGLDPRPGR